MAVARMLKVTAFGYRTVLDDVVAALQREGVLEVAQQPFEIQSGELSSGNEQLRRYEELAADAIFLRDFLGRYHVSDAPLSTFVSEKFHLDEDEFVALEADEPVVNLYRECLGISDALASGERERVRLTALAHDLTPWQDFSLQISQWRETDHVAMIAGTVPPSQSSRVREQLRQVSPLVTVEELGPVGARQAWVVMVHASVLPEVRSALAAAPFQEVSFPGLTDYPAEELARASERIVDLAVEKEALEKRASELSGEHYARAVALAEVFGSRLDALRIRAEFGATERAFVITGWIRESHRARLEATVNTWSKDLELVFDEVTDDDTPPIELDNPGWLKPFEVLTDLYGRPGYREVDPTILLAPFFLLFFAICISDVGYGAMLIAGFYYIKTKLDVAPGVKRFADLMMYGGFAAMGLGVAFASYFAIPYDTLKEFAPFLASLQVLDPLNELTTFLVVTMILGVIQVFFGITIAAWQAWKSGDPGAAIAEQLSTIFLFAMFGVALFVPGSASWAIPVGLGVTMLAQGRTIKAALETPDVAGWQRGVGVAWVALTLAWIAALAMSMPASATWTYLAITALGVILVRAVRKAFIGLLGGAYAVYGMSALIGDILSYTRLAALGLSGALVGMVFNLLAGLVWAPAIGLFEEGGISILYGAIVALMAVLVFAGGHVFNVVINLLGAFVHPARLQFVEFFSKFYVGGGRPFAPFRFRTKSLVLRAGVAGREGGTGS